ncbi:hypothetical protein ACP4OV_011067 [Aristida adscensionis]
MASSRRMPPLPLPLLAVLIVTATGRVAGAGPTICDTAKCGKGTCVETVALLFIPAYNCTCDPGWSHLIDLAPFTPCVIPNCTMDSSCLDPRPTVPKGIPITDPCVFANCGRGGECIHGEGWGYQCGWHQGFTNMLNDTSMPCINGVDCRFGADCAKLGLTNPPAAGSPAPAPA